MSRDKWLLVVFTGGILGICLSADLGYLKPLLRWLHSIPFGDKVIHALLMGGVCWQADRAIRSRPIFSFLPHIRRTHAVVALIVIVEEFSQRLVPSRTFSYGDLAADGVGIAVAILFGGNQRNVVLPERKPPKESN